MTEKDALDPRFLELASRFLDGAANPEDLETLHALLNSDPEAVRTLSELLNQHGTLALSLRGEAAYRERAQASPASGKPVGSWGSLRRAWWMAIPIAACIAIIATIALDHGQPPATKEMPVVPSHRVLSFQGAKDTKIVEHRSSQRFGKEILLEVEGGDKEGESTALLQWDLSMVPAGSKIQSATITLFVPKARERGTLYKVCELKRDWSEEEATWNFAREGDPWDVPGAKGPQDRASSILADFQAKKGTLKVSLNDLGLAVVERWVRTPRDNRGLALAYFTEEGEFYFYSRKAEDVSKRPVLTLTFTPPEK